MRGFAARALLSTVLVFSTLVAVRSITTSPPNPRHLPIRGDVLRDLALPFVENRGQLGREVDYFLEGPGASVGFTPRGVLISTDSEAPGSGPIELTFPGARTVAPVGLDRTPTVVSYFRGRPNQWITALPTFSRVR
ncbi:MAG: hypothetical protein ACRDKA_13640, partial [Actinomycetota bacterium]